VKKFIRLILCRLGFHKGKYIRTNPVPSAWGYVNAYECEYCKERYLATSPDDLFKCYYRDMPKYMLKNALEIDKEEAGV